MQKLPEDICSAWNERDGAVVLTTVSEDGTPNSIYATCVGLHNESSIVIADNYFCKTRDNINNGSVGCVLFITKDGKAYQIKGKLELFSEGDFYDFMKSWNPDKHPGHAAAVLTPDSVYSGASQIC